MWYSAEKYNEGVVDLNSELKLLEGELEDKEARISLAKFSKETT